jgi:hypothetical protein
MINIIFSVHLIIELYIDTSATVVHFFHVEGQNEISKEHLIVATAVIFLLFLATQILFNVKL